MATTSAQIQQLYVAYLGRAADKAGLDYWFNQLNASPATLTLEDLRSNFVNEQPEYSNAYAGLTRSETVSKIYLNLFGKSADAAGLAYWTTGGGSTVNADQLLQAFINGASPADAQVVANKVIVSEVYTSTAGANYSQADAVAVLKDVNGTSASVTAALDKLSNGSLAGITVPAGVAIIKADASADAAVTAYEQSQVASLKALNDKVVALNAGYTAALDPVADGGDDGSAIDKYSEVSAAINNATALRTNISALSTAQLELDAKVAADALVAERATLVSTSPTAVADINAYNAAVAADAALSAPSTGKVDTNTAALQGVISTNAAAFTAANNAYIAAGGTTIADADALFAAISTANAATLAKIDAAFNTGVFAQTYANVKADGVAQAAKNASTTALTKAEMKVGAAYVSDAKASAAANKLVVDAKAADALKAEAAVVTTARDALVKVADDTEAALTAMKADYGVDVTALLTTVAGTAKADLFFFTNNTHVNDFSVTAFNKGDAIYIGEGYTFTTGVTLGTDGFYTGTNLTAKEVFFTQAAPGSVVKVIIEGNALGQVAGTTGADNVTEITLIGITSLTDVSYANGVITSNLSVA